MTLPPSFHSIEDSTKEEKKPSLPPPSFKKPEIPQTPEGASQFSIGALESAISSPGQMGEFLNFLLDLLPQSEKQKKIRRKALKTIFPQFKADIEDIKKYEKGLVGEKLQPKTPSGRIGRRAGEFAGMGFVNPEQAAAELGTAALSGGLGESAREIGLPEGIAAPIELLSGLISKGGKKLLSPHKEGSLAKELKGEKLQKYKDYKDIGLTDEQITPLLQTDKKLNLLGLLAKKNKKTKEALFETEKGIGELYKPVKEEARQIGKLSQNQLKDFNKEIKENLKEIKKGVNPSKEKQKAINYLENSLNNLKGNILGPQGETISFKFKDSEDILNFFQEINDAGLWDRLTPVKNTIVDFLHKIDPKLAKKFVTTNDAFSKIKKLQSKIGVGNYEKLVGFGEKVALGGSLLKFLATGEPGILATTVLGETLARQLSTKLLFDPRYQNIFKNSIKSIEKTSPQLGKVAYEQLKDLIKKDYPEEYEKIDWETL